MIIPPLRHNPFTQISHGNDIVVDIPTDQRAWQSKSDTSSPNCILLLGIETCRQKPGFETFANNLAFENCEEDVSMGGQSFAVIRTVSELSRVVHSFPRVRFLASFSTMQAKPIRNERPDQTFDDEFGETEYLKTEKSPKIEVQGNKDNMNLIGPVLIAILSSDYFKSLSELKSFSPVITEIERSVTDLGMFAIACLSFLTPRTFWLPQHCFEVFLPDV